MNRIYCIEKGKIFSFAKIPFKTHNAQPYKEGVLFNDTHNNCIKYTNWSGKLIQKFIVVKL